MPSITLNFTAPLNTSCQVGDTAYYMETQTTGGFTIGAGAVVEIGQIRQIDGANTSTPTVICDTILPGNLNATNRFILFSKDNKANLSSLLGYYASIKFVNNSTGESELFNVGMVADESSK